MSEKDNQETKYIKKYLKEYEDYLSPENNCRSEEEDEMHQNSTPVIEQFKREKLTHGVEFTTTKSGKGGRGKSRMFSNFAFIADESTQLDKDFSLMNEDMDSHDDLMSPVAKLVASHSALSSKQQRAKVVKSKEEEKEEVEEAAAIGTEAAPGVFISAYAQPKVLSRVAFAGNLELGSTVSFKKADKTKQYKKDFLSDGMNSEWEHGLDGEDKQIDYEVARK